MTNDPREERIEALFHEALSRPLEERSLFLEKACEDAPEIKAEVEALLESKAEAAEFFAQPPWKLLADGAVEQPPRERTVEAQTDLPVARLGEFRLVRKLGIGGMGVVYLAEQEPFGRLAALKVFRGERFGPIESQSRFRREIQAVAELRHPHIVSLYASGEEEGLLYYAMEYVKGDSLGAKLRQVAARREKIAVARILKWIKQTAVALDFAHEAGIIHRDVKPSNILISPEDQALLADFGIAKQVKLPTFTRSGEFRGTPHYASPEQVKAQRDRIDARTDVYSLGVTLYEALTGRVPFGGETTEQIFYQILNADPIPLRRLDLGISSDIETVTMKALEREPGRRYQTMAEFAADLERILEGQVILAKPAGLGARFLKSVKRNPVRSTVVGMVLLALLCFSGYIRFVSYPRLQKALNDEVAARKESEKQTRISQAVTRFLCNRVLTAFDPDISDDVAIVEKMLGRAEDFIENDLNAVPVAKARIHRGFAESYFKASRWERAFSHYATALDLSRDYLGDDHPETWRCLFQYARHLAHWGRDRDAEPVLRKYLASARPSLGEGHPDVMAASSTLAGALGRTSRFDEAVALLGESYSRMLALHGEHHRSTLKAMSRLGEFLVRHTDRASRSEGKNLLQDCLENQRRLVGNEDPDTLATIRFLANMAAEHGDYEDNLRLHLEWVDGHKESYGPDSEETLSSRIWLAEAVDRTGDFRKAEDEYRSVMDDCRRILGESDGITALAMYDLAVFLTRRGSFEEAQSLHRRALEAREQVYPGVTSVLWSLHSHAELLRLMGRLEEAEQSHRKALNKPQVQKDPCISCVFASRVARLLEDQENYSEAESLHRRLVRDAEELHSRRHTHFTKNAVDLAGYLDRRGRYSEAAELLRGVLETLQECTPRHYRHFEAASALGSVLIGQERFEEAEGYLLEAHEGLRRIPYAYFCFDGLGLVSIERLGRLYEKWGKPEEAAFWQARRDRLRATLAAAAEGTYADLEPASESVGN